MIINVKGTEIIIVIPDGYTKLAAKNPIDELHNNRDGIYFYQKATSNANCVISVVKIFPQKAMPFDDPQSVINGIHEALGENQGLIEVSSGVTDRGYQFIYSIVKDVDKENLSVAYILRLHLMRNGVGAEISGDFAECGTTGIRDAMGFECAQRANLVHFDAEGKMAGWSEDPYDSSYTRGIPMALSERPGLDGLFPNHPLSQLREMIHAVLKDELMHSPDDPVYSEMSSNENTSSNQKESDSVPTKETESDDISHEEMSEEEMCAWILSKDSIRRFIPEKINVESSTSETQNSNTNKFKKVLQKGSEYTADGVAFAKKKLGRAKEEVVKATGIVRDKSHEIQMAALKYIDTKKNARFLDAKLSAFEDGMKAGKIEAVDYIKKYANFCLASTAISYYFARCDGSIDEDERLEIDYDLNAIIKNKDLPESLRNTMFEISQKEDLAFEDVCKYLDGVGVDTLKEFLNDIDEIIIADDVVSPDEERAKKEFEAYLKKRMEDTQK